MLGMNFTSFLTLLVLSVVVAAVITGFCATASWKESIPSSRRLRWAGSEAGWVRRYWDIGCGRSKASTWYRRFWAGSPLFT